MESGASQYTAFQVWGLAARPKTLPASIVPVIVGSVMAWHAGAFSPLVFLLTMLAALLIQIGTNYANDYYDFKKGADSAGRQGPLRMTQAGLVSPVQMRAAAFLVLGLALLCGLYLVWIGGLPILVIGLTAVVFAVLYTAGPLPLAYVGLGELFVLIFFGPVAAGGTYYLQTGYITAPVLWIGAGLGFISTAILVVNNLRDRQSDALNQKLTLAVRCGSRFAQFEFTVLLLLAAVIPLVLYTAGGVSKAVLLPVLYLGAALRPLKTVWYATDLSRLNDTLEYTGRLLCLYGLLFCLGWVW